MYLSHCEHTVGLSTPVWFIPGPTRERESFSLYLFSFYTCSSSVLGVRDDRVVSQFLTLVLSNQYTARSLNEMLGFFWGGLFFFFFFFFFFYSVRCLMALSHCCVWEKRKEGRKGNVLFNDALNTFYLRLCGVRRMAKYHTYSERGNLLPPQLFLVPASAPRLV